MSRRSLAVAAFVAVVSSAPSASAAPAPVGGDAFSAGLPGSGAWFQIDPGGIVVDDGEAPVTLRTEAIGRRGDLRPQPLARPALGSCWPTGPRLAALACDAAIERPLDGAVERWQARGDALEHGFTVTSVPPGEGALVVVVAVAGADVSLDGAVVRLATDVRTWTYTGLRAWDARGLALPSRFEVEGDRIALVIDDADATFPVTIDPVLSTASRTLTQTSTDFGIGVALGGDANKDGYADLVVGARFGTALYGEAFGYLGSATGIPAAYARKWAGTDYYGKFGEYVDLGGDVNGDGYDDALVCEFYSERFFVYHGSSAGFSANANKTVTGNYGLGRDLAILGDLDHDGYDDVIAGSQEPDVAFYKGSSSGLTITALITVATSGAPSVAGAGHTNNDVYDDAIYGDPTANKAYLVRGSASISSTSFPGNTTTLTYAGSASLGFDVTGRGDVNGDGYDDVAVGDPDFSSGVGRVVVFYGASGGISSANAAVLASPSAAATGFGYTVQMVGDVNNDGFADLAVSDGYDSAYTYIFRGSATGLVAKPVNTLTTGSSNFGYAIGGGGDVDGDGYDDVAIGDIGTAVYIYHGCADADGDGYCIDLDCNDGSSAQSPSATESCNGIDDDCDGKTDDADTAVSGQTTWYRDADGDGFGTPATTKLACSKPVGYVANAADCNDGSDAVKPDAPETCNSVDDDCDGKTDDADSPVSGQSTWYRDADGDGFGTPATTTLACGKPTGYVADATDCNDGSGSVKPGATESCNGVDDDCDGKTDDADAPVSGQSTWYADSDGDGFGAVGTTKAACVKPTGYVADHTDCNDGSDAVKPGATESCNGVDDDCDGKTDDADSPVSGQSTWYRDADGDGFGTSSTTTAACARPAGYVADKTDCNDASGAVKPGATEACNGFDDDCDGKVDDADTNVSGQSAWYADSDGDGFGALATTTAACAKPVGYVADHTDCNDGSGAVKPGATESCNDVDDDCDGKTDDADTNVAGQSSWYADSDGDGFGAVASTTTACAKPVGYVADHTDCNDGSDAVKPGATERCNGVDDDCDGEIDDADSGVTGQSTWYRDADGDEFGAAAAMKVACDAPAGYVGDATDCDDGAAAVKPGAAETCNGVDDDCDGATDDADSDVRGQATWFVDADGDGFGAAGTTQVACDAPTGYVAADGDCDDATADRKPGQPETCNGIDDDCDGLVDDADTDRVGGSVWHRDADGDGFGDPATAETTCVAEDGWVADATDCDDAAATTHAGATELCNGADDDCNGQTDEGFAGLGAACDGDDADTCAAGVLVCAGDGSGTTCDETQPTEGACPTTTGDKSDGCAGGGAEGVLGLVGALLALGVRRGRRRA